MMSLPSNAVSSSTTSRRKNKLKRFHDTTTPLSILVKPTIDTLLSSLSEYSLSFDSRATNTKLIRKHSANLSKKRTFRLTWGYLHQLLRDKFVSDSLLSLSNGT